MLDRKCRDLENQLMIIPQLEHRLKLMGALEEENQGLREALANL